jgi:osmoprotectant transport system substrate-binding protein
MRKSASAAFAFAIVGTLALGACGSDKKTDSTSASTVAGATTAPATGGGSSIDCGNLFSTEPAISTDGFVALDDDKGLVPNEAVLPLMTKDIATPAVLAVVNGVSAKLDTAGLTKLLAEVVTDKKGPDEVAKEFVDSLAAPTKSTDGTKIVIGSADFPENQLLAEIYGQQLTKAGYKIEQKPAIGSREVYYKALTASPAEVNLIPEYTNSLLSYVIKLKDATATPTAKNVAEQVTALGTALPAALTVGTPSTAEDKDVIVCTQAIADQYQLKTLSDLAKVADKITIGGPPEFETRSPFGLVGFKDLLGANFKKFVPLAIADIPAALKG